jgi:hypothetical protein
MQRLARDPVAVASEELWAKPRFDAQDLEAKPSTLKAVFWRYVAARQSTRVRASRCKFKRSGGFVALNATLAVRLRLLNRF